MLFNISDGRTIDIPLNLYLRMDDDEFEKELEDLMASGIGNQVNDPFYNSSLTSEGFITLDDISEIPLDDLSPEDKLEDLDINFMD